MNEIRVSVDKSHIDETTTALLERIGVGLGHGDIVFIFPLYSIPNGWSFRSSEDDGVNYFIDERGNKRVAIWDVSDEFGVCDIEFCVLTRYSIEHTGCGFIVNDRMIDAPIYLSTNDNWFCLCKWLNAHYPDWENPAAYWGDETK